MDRSGFCVSFHPSNEFSIIFFFLENLYDMLSLLSASTTSYWVLHPDLNAAVQE